MKARCRANAVGLPLEGGTVGELRIFEFLDRVKVAVDQDAVGQPPQVFGGLQFRRVRR
jgi:hypothetical protein